MADNYLETSCDGRFHSIELAVLAYEIRVLIEVLLMGITSLIEDPQAAPIREELGVLAKLAGQGADALIAFDAALETPDEGLTRLSA